MASSARSVFVTGGDTKRTIHSRSDCKQLAAANKVLEKPAAAFPPGYFDRCEWCHEGGGGL